MNPDLLIQGILQAKQAEADKQELAEADSAAQEEQERNFAIEQVNRVTTQIAQASQLMVTFLKHYEPTVKGFPDTIATPDVNKVVNQLKRMETTLRPDTKDDSELINAIGSLVPELQKIQALEVSPEINLPAPIVQAPDLSPILDALKDVMKAVKAIKIPEPVVPDNSDIIKALAAVQTEVRKKPVPGVATPQTDPLIRYTPADIDDASSVQYFGYIASDGSWYIRKFDTGANPKTLRFAFGTPLQDYTTNWTNRAALTYKLWSQ